MLFLSGNLCKSAQQMHCNRLSVDPTVQVLGAALGQVLKERHIKLKERHIKLKAQQCVCLSLFTAQAPFTAVQQQARCSVRVHAHAALVGAWTRLA